MASPDRSLSALERTIAALRAWFEAERVPAVFIGGVAVSLIGRPRTTKDVDAVVWLPEEERWGPFLAAGARHGIVGRIPDPIAFARASRVFLLQHAPSGVEVDVSVGALPFEERAIQRAGRASVGTFEIAVPTPEDLIVLKAIAHRPRDMSDIETVLDAHPNIDAREILDTVRDFAHALDMPEIAEDLERLLQRAAASDASTRKRRSRGAATDRNPEGAAAAKKKRDPKVKASRRKR